MSPVSFFSFLLDVYFRKALLGKQHQTKGKSTEVRKCFQFGQTTLLDPQSLFLFLFRWRSILVRGLNPSEAWPLGKTRQKVGSGLWWTVLWLGKRHSCILSLSSFIWFAFVNIPRILVGAVWPWGNIRKMCMQSDWNQNVLIYMYSPLSISRICFSWTQELGQGFFPKISSTPGGTSHQMRQMMVAVGNFRKKALWIGTSHDICPIQSRLRDGEPPGHVLGCNFLPLFLCASGGERGRRPGIQD